MASLDRRLNPLYAIKECSSCGNLHTKDCGCSKGSLEDKILVPIPDLSQRPLKIEKICLDCGDPVHGLYCRQCALIRKTLEEVFQDFQDTSKSSNDDTNFVNQEPFVVKQGPGVNSSQSPPQINHNCCYECGDSLDDIFCQRCTCKSCGKGAHYGYNCPPQIPIISNPEPCYNQNLNEIPQNLQSLQQQCLFGSRTHSETESDEFIKSSVENLFPTPSEPEDFSDIESECDVLVCDNLTNFSNPLFDANDDDASSDEEEFKISSNPLFDLDEVSPIDDEVLESITSIPPGIDSFDAESDLIESLLNRDTSFDSSSKIDFLLDEFAGELTRLQSIPPGIDNINLDPEGDIFFLESLLYDNSSPRPPEEFNSENSIESFSPSPIPVEDSDSLMEEIDIFLDGDDSIPPGIESDDFDSEDDDNSTSRPEFESFHVDYPDSGDSTIDVVEDIPIDVPNILPTHLALQLDFNFIPSLNDLGSDLDVSSPSGDSNKIYDPGICIEVESTRFLSTLSPVIDTLLSFSSENKDILLHYFRGDVPAMDIPDLQTFPKDN
ncbi:hypothetical protein Tco_1525285 [Tanacetum coccineum]